MNKRTFVFLTLILGLILAACATAQTAQTKQTTSPAAGSGSTTSMDVRLASGIFKLEGSDQAITAQQAKDLLPLWKAVRALSAKNTTATEEMQGLYDQIQEAMTADQVKTIKDLALNNEELTALAKSAMAQYGLAAGAQAQGTQPTRTSSSSSRSNQGGGPGGGPGGMPGGMPPDMGGAGGMGGQFGAQTTPGAAGLTTQRSGTNQFIEPLIAMLQKRAAGN